MIYFHIGKLIFTEHPELKQYVKICNSIRDINRNMPEYAQQNVTTYIPHRERISMSSRYASSDVGRSICISAMISVAYCYISERLWISV